LPATSIVDQTTMMAEKDTESIKPTTDIVTTNPELPSACAARPVLPSK